VEYKGGIRELHCNI